MNDKLHLYLKTGLFTFDRQKFNYNPETINLETGETVGSAKYFRNPKQNNELCTLDIDAHGLRLIMNPNKVKGIRVGSEPLTYQQFKNSVEEVNTFLSENKIIDCKLNESKISRFDNSFDILAPLEYKYYEPILKTLASKAKPIKQGKKRIIENTIYNGNKQTEIAIYDKKHEADLNDDYIRFELRHLKTKLHPNYKKLTVGSVDQDKFYNIRTSDKGMIDSYVFGQEPQLLKDELINNIVAYFLYLIEEPTLNMATINKSMAGYLLKSYELSEDTPGIIANILRRGIHQKDYRRNNAYINLVNGTTLADTEFMQRYTELKNLFREVA
jgi:hypothetical protein